MDKQTPKEKAESGESEQRQSQLLFLPTSTDRHAVREAIRVHTMRESHRHRRRQQSEFSGRSVRGGSFHLFDSTQLSSPSVDEDAPVASSSRIKENTEQKQSPISFVFENVTGNPGSQALAKSNTLQQHVAESTQAALSMPRSMHSDLQFSDDDFVMTSMSFFLSSFGPSIYRRWSRRMHPHDTLFLQELYPRLMTNEMAVAVCTVFASLVLDMAKSRPNFLTRRALQYWNKSFALLRQSVAIPETATSDEVLLTICVMFGIECLLGNFEQALIHLNGARQIAAIRAGQALTPLPEDDSFPFENIQQTAEPSKAFAVLQGPPVNDSSIALLPMGFQALYFSNSLGADLMELLQEFQTEISLRPTSLALFCGAWGVKCIEILQLSTTSVTEQVVALALLAACVFFDESGISSTVTNSYLQIHCFWLMNEQLKGMIRSDVLTWAATTLRIAWGTDSNSSRLANYMVEPSLLSLDVSDTVTTCEYFFWNEAMTKAYVEYLNFPLEGESRHAKGNPEGARSDDKDESEEQILEQMNRWLLDSEVIQALSNSMGRVSQRNRK